MGIFSNKVITASCDSSAFVYDFMSENRKYFFKLFNFELFEYKKSPNIQQCDVIIILY